jgi:hypothetical protein
MDLYFKVMTWLYTLVGLAAAVMTVYFQVKGMRDEAIYTLVCVLVCGMMLGLRSWQKKRVAKIETFLKEKHEAQQKEKQGKKK